MCNLLLIVLSLLIVFPTSAFRRGGYGPIGIRSAKLTDRYRKTSSNSRGNSFTKKPSNALSFLEEEEEHGHDKVELCATGASEIAKELALGAFLRVASDITIGTPLENIKCRVTGTLMGPIEATKSIIKETNLGGLWSGTPSRTIEGALLGAIYMLGSAVTKKQLLAMGASRSAAALAGGLVGGVAQSVVMTPAGMVFTSLNLNRGKKGYENDNMITVGKRIIDEKGITGLYFGVRPMAYRQATNWASRSGFTEICRSTLKLSKYGMMGEIASGAIGGVGSCWNTPIETIRVLMQADVSAGRPTKTFSQYWDTIVEEQGYQGLFRGGTPRAVQAIWQTVFMVVVPNMMGL